MKFYKLLYETGRPIAVWIDGKEVWFCGEDIARAVSARNPAGAFTKKRFSASALLPKHPGTGYKKTFVRAYEVSNWLRYKSGEYRGPKYKRVGQFLERLFNEPIARYAIGVYEQVEESPRIWTVRRICDGFNVPEQFVRDQMAAGALRGLRISGVWAFSDKDIREWTTEHAPEIARAEARKHRRDTVIKPTH